MEPAQTIIEKLGGATVIAEALKLHRTRVSCWRLPKARGGTDGRIPQWHIPALMALASDRGVEISPIEFIAVPAQSLPIEGDAA